MPIFIILSGVSFAISSPSLCLLNIMPHRGIRNLRIAQSIQKYLCIYFGGGIDDMDIFYGEKLKNSCVVYRHLMMSIVKSPQFYQHHSRITALSMKFSPTIPYGPLSTSLRLR